MSRLLLRALLDDGTTEIVLHGRANDTAKSLLNAVALADELLDPDFGSPLVIVVSMEEDKDG